MGGGRAEAFELQLLGPVTVRRQGATMVLPPSRKTRALLAYLALSGRPERRERLCELFWDVPDDPRGALRWSLSKLRALVDESDVLRLQADREWVALRLDDAAVDFSRLRALVADGVENARTEDLEAVAGAGEFLEGLELPRCDRFEAWRIAHQADARRWRAAVLEELTRRPIPPDVALGHARRWTEIDGEEPEPWVRLIELLETAGWSGEAQAQRSIAQKRLAAAGKAIPEALRTLRPALPPRSPQALQVRFCTASDKTSIAYAIEGDGPPLVKTANWMTHLERDAQGPIWRHWIAEFTGYRTFLRYDQRGNGLSDWDAPFSQAAFVDDLECVVDDAGLERFDLLAISQGASVALAYAVRHPERVRKIVLLGAFTRGWKHRSTPEQLARREAMLTLTRTGWDEDNPAFRQLFTSLFIPDADPETQDWFNTTQRAATNGANAAAIQECGADLDVHQLLPKVRAPTVVAHRREDAVVPFEVGREIARSIPKARFLPLEGRNHLLLEHEPAWRRFADATRAFLED